MRIFIDSNVLISGVVFDRNELELMIESVEHGYQLYISDHIMEECTRVFLKKFPNYLSLFNSFIQTAGFNVVAKKKYSRDIQKFKDIRDKYDAHVVACARKMKCHYIITGDKDILDYSIKDMKVMNSSSFIEMFFVGKL